MKQGFGAWPALSALLFLSLPVCGAHAQAIIGPNFVTFTGPDQTVDQDFNRVSFHTQGFDASFSGAITGGFVKHDAGRLVLLEPLAYPYVAFDFQSAIVGGIVAGTGEMFAGRGILLVDDGQIEITGGRFTSEVQGSPLGPDRDRGILITGTVEIESISGNPFGGPVTLRNGAVLTVIRPRFLAYSSGLDMDGTSTYVLRPGPGLSIPALVADGASFRVDAGRGAMIEKISGGVWNKVGAGELSLTSLVAAGAPGVNVLEGRLRGNYLNLPGTIALSGGTAVEFSETMGLAPDGTFAGTITGAGALEKTDTDILYFTGTAAQTGGTTIAGGELHIGKGGTTGALAGDVVNNGALVFNRRDDVRFAGAISGTGSVRQDGTGKLVLAGTSAYQGDTFANAGTLIVNGVLDRSHVLVAGGATLGGSGRIDSATIAAGAVLSPGNSIGTLSVAGDLLLAPGSTFRVEADPTHADRVSVGGTATVSGANLVVVAAGSDPATAFAPNATYSILSAANPVVGRVASVADDFAFLDASVDYASDPNAVSLVLTRNAVGIAAVADTGNQRGAASALAGFDPADPVYRQLLGLSVQQAQQAYDAVSGEVHASGQVLSGQGFNAFTSLIGTGSPGSVGGAQSAPISYGPTPGTAVASALDVGLATPKQDARALSAWLTPMGNRGVVDASTTTAALDWTAGGLAGGLENQTRLAGGILTYGLGAGFVVGSSSVPARASTMKNTAGFVGAYAGWTDGALSLKGNIAYGAEHIDTTRRITVGAIDRTATAQYWNHTVGIGAEIDYLFHLTDAFTIGPVARADISWSGHDTFTETGAGSLNATVAGQSRTGLDTGLGIALGYTVELAEGATLVLNGRALWQHDWGPAATDQTVSLAGGGGAFTVAGAPTSQDRLQLGAGLAYSPQPGSQLSLDYVGTFSQGQASHGVSAGFKLSF